MFFNKLLNEPELLRRVAESDQAAFRIIFDQYRNTIFSIAFKLLRDEALAEDAVQEVFVKLWLKKEQLWEINNFSAYIKTVTRNYLFNQLKRLAYAEKYLKNTENGMGTDSNAIEAGVEWKELKVHLDKVISKLPPQQGKVYWLGKEQGLKYEEIASHLHISKETVKTHMSDALRFIKKELLHYGSVITCFISLFPLL